MHAIQFFYKMHVGKVCLTVASIGPAGTDLLCNLVCGLCLAPWMVNSRHKSSHTHKPWHGYTHTYMHAWMQLPPLLQMAMLLMAMYTSIPIKERVCESSMSALLSAAVIFWKHGEAPLDALISFIPPLLHPPPPHPSLQPTVSVLSHSLYLHSLPCLYNSQCPWDHQLSLSVIFLYHLSNLNFNYCKM